MITPESAHCERVKAMMREGEFPVTALPIRLKDGREIVNATPYTIARTKINDEETLGLFLLDEHKKAFKVGVGEVEGLEVTKGEGEYEGKWLVSFTYYKPTADGQQFMEEKPRRVLIYEIRHGVNEAHYGFGEGFDFYLVGEDTQYLQSPPADRGRQFPVWRDGVYGQSPQVEPSFKREQPQQ